MQYKDCLQRKSRDLAPSLKSRLRHSGRIRSLRRTCVKTCAQGYIQIKRVRRTLTFHEYTCNFLSRRPVLSFANQFFQQPSSSSPHVSDSSRSILESIIIIMGIWYSKARYLAPASFLFDFAAQQYGMLSSPNMKDVHDANLSFFSPQPYFIALFFFPQQIAQLVWLWKLWKKDGTEKEVQEMVDYTPVYALGNICIGSEF